MEAENPMQDSDAGLGGVDRSQSARNMSQTRKKTDKKQQQQPQKETRKKHKLINVQPFFC